VQPMTTPQAGKNQRRRPSWSRDQLLATAMRKLTALRQACYGAGDQARAAESHLIRARECMETVNHEINRIESFGVRPQLNPPQFPFAGWHTKGVDQ